MSNTRIVDIESIPVSVPYRHRELSSQVARDGVSDVLVRVTAEDGAIGWGEACCGADTESVRAAVEAMALIVVGRDAWSRTAIKRDLFSHGLWQFRAGTGNFAWAGIDMALLDLCGKDCGEPLYRLLGGLARSDATYFYYLARTDDEDLRRQCQDGLAAGFDVFYLKVGIDDAGDVTAVAAVRDALGEEPRLRIDANGTWSVPQALRNLEAMREYDIEFVEQPVRDHPLAQMRELRERSPVRVCANEGLWSEADAYARITGRTADVFCFSTYWVGGLDAFVRLAHVAALEGLEVCKHTHGELGLAAAAGQHALLTLPNVVEGNQQTAYMMEHDVLREQLPIATGPRFGVPDGVGLCVEVDEDAVAEAATRYRSDGQYLPWAREQLGREERTH